MRLPSFVRVGLVATVALAACHRAVRDFASTLEPTSSTAVYDGIVRIDPQIGALEAVWTLRLTRHAEADSLVLLLNSGITIAAVTGSDVQGYKVRGEGDYVRLTLSLAPRTDAHDTQIQLQYSGRAQFGDDGINRIAPEWVELGLDSFWFPVVADFAHEVRGRVRIVLPKGYRVVSSGAQQSRGDTTEIVNARALYDFAFVASPAMRTTSQGRVLAHDTGSPPLLVQRVLASGAKCIDYLNARYGRLNPIPTADIVIAQRNGPGYARQRYVVISVGSSTVTDAPDDSVGRADFVCHEFAHFWSIGANPSGPDNWLNEGFAEFVSGRAIRSLYGEAAWIKLLTKWREGTVGQGPVWTATSSARPSEKIAYQKAPALLAELEARIGRERMDALLARFMTGPMRSTPVVLDMIDREIGVDDGAWFRSAIGR